MNVVLKGENVYGGKGNVFEAKENVYGEEVSVVLKEENVYGGKENVVWAKEIADHDGGKESDVPLAQDGGERSS